MDDFVTRMFKALGLVKVRDTSLKVRGRVRVYVDGELRGDHSNLVVDSGLEALAKAWTGEPAMVLSLFEAGDGTTLPAAGDTALQNSTFGPKAITSISFPSDGALKATMNIVAGEATGLSFTEFGLFTTGGQIIARVVDGNTYTKTALNNIQIVWDIIIAV